MTTTPSARLGLAVDELDDGPPDGPNVFLNELAAVIDDQVAIDDQGNLASRPVSTSGSPGIRGRYYFVTGDSDTSQNGILYRDNGAGWDAVGGNSGPWLLPGEISPTTISADQNNYNPTGLSGASTLRLASSLNVSITGLAGAAKGRMLIVENVGSFQIALRHENVASGAVNRFALSNDVVMRPGDGCILRYDIVVNRWRCVAVNLTLPPGWVSGGINSDGTRRYGSGFASSRTSLGHFRIDFTPAFPSPPSIKFTSVDASVMIASIGWPATDHVLLTIVDRQQNPVDGGGVMFDALPSGA